MPIKKIRPTFTFDEDRLAELKQVVPEAFADGKVKWEVLREVLGDHLEDADDEIERFGLFWPGMREARRLASVTSNGTLVPQPGLGVDEESTHNVFIEGENLEVLKLLQKSYANRVKLIYVDPPYNTGNDFVYSDDYSEPLRAYLQRTGQADEAGQLVTTNTRTSGRFHSRWLSMMYPRLRLARQLLRDDGIIFVSIDDNEMHHLKLLMNEVFGEENHLAVLVWKKKYTGGQHATHFVDLHEYILVYAKSRDDVGELLVDRPEDQKDKFEYEDEYVATRGRYYTRPLKSNLAERPTLVYPIEMPDGSKIKTQWLVARDTFEQLKNEGRIEFRKKRDGSYQVYKKYYEMDGGGKVKIPTILEDVAYNTDAKEDYKELFDVERARDIPIQTIKPVALLELLIDAATDNTSLVLDFFAGSCSTAHAVLDLNREDAGARRFIMVQLPEPTEDSDYPSIAHIGRERIRRVIAQMQAENEGKLSLQTEEDLGFKCYRLARSNYKPWRDVTTPDVGQIEMAFDRFETPLVEDWERDELFTEVLLIEGFPLDSAVTRQQQFRHNQVDLVISDLHEHRLLVCLDETIASQTIAQLDLADTDVFVCLDAALSDEAKVRLSDTGNIHVI